VTKLFRVTKDLKNNIANRVHVDYTHIPRYLRTCSVQSPTNMISSESMIGSESIAGVPFDSYQAFPDYLTTAHHSYAFLTAREG